MQLSILNHSVKSRGTCKSNLFGKLNYVSWADTRHQGKPLYPWNGHHSFGPIIHPHPTPMLGNRQYGIFRLLLLVLLAPRGVIPQERNRTEDKDNLHRIHRLL